jgi:hypothetical protein
VLFNAVALAGPLADSPLSLKGSVPPNVLFTPSVEWPTAVVYAYKDPDLAGNKGPDGAAASSSVPADNYSAATEYLGFWDPNKCYTYDGTNGWFVPAAVATAHACSSQWSGNFMNWMSLTAIDIFRFAMTGGNRYQDTSTLTVLEVSYHDGQGGMTNFPTHTVNGATANGATTLGSIGPFYFRRQGLGTQMTYGAVKGNVEGTSGLTVGNTTVNLRVKVCDTTIALEDNCRIFGTSWKPTGVVHDYSDRMKFGVFSYYLLSDPANANTAMNTVMRSKLKYVGPTKFVAGSGWSGTNANTEWNSADEPGSERDLGGGLRQLRRHELHQQVRHDRLRQHALQGLRRRRAPVLRGGQLSPRARPDEQPAELLRRHHQHQQRQLPGHHELGRSDQLLLPEELHHRHRRHLHALRQAPAGKQVHHLGVRRRCADQLGRAARRHGQFLELDRQHQHAGRHSGNVARRPHDGLRRRRERELPVGRRRLLGAHPGHPAG